MNFFSLLPLILLLSNIQEIAHVMILSRILFILAFSSFLYSSNLTCIAFMGPLLFLRFHGAHFYFYLFHHSLW